MTKKAFLFSLIVLYVGLTQAAAPVGETIWLHWESTGSYVTMDPSNENWLAVQNTSSVEANERFIVEDAGSGNIRLKSAANNNYVKVDTADVKKLKANTTSTTDPLAHFEWIELGNGNVRLKNIGNNSYVRPGGASNVLRANTTSVPTTDTTQFTWGPAGDLPATGWRVIGEDAAYPTDDVIVAFCEVTDPAYHLPDDPVNLDCTAAFQAALDDAGAAGGGTVFVPEGQYRIDGMLTIDTNVHLRGRWRPITDTQPAGGTILALYNTDPNDTVITVSGAGCGVRDLTFWHPNQDATNPTPYPLVIAANGGRLTIENITMINAYNGIDVSRASMCFLRGIYGSPLQTGLIADRSYSVSRFDSVHFSPDCWAWSGLPGSPSAGGAHETYMRNYGTAVNIREMDGFYLVFSTISGYQKGIILGAGVTGDDPWGTMGYVTASNCDYGLYIEQCKNIKMCGCTFEGSVNGITGENDGSIKLTMNTCTLEGGTNSIALANGSASLVNCTVTGPTSATGSAVISEATYAEVMPVFDNNYDRVRKPSKTDLFNVQDYGAVGNGVTDDTLAIQQAVSDAVSNGGGIVLVPDGEYLMTGNLDLGIGVELRGNSGGRHDADLNDELGSLLLIDVGFNQPNGTPFITMGDYSGLRGISFLYPNQNYTDDSDYDAYPLMVLANGYKNYIIDCFAANAYQAAELNGDEHLIEYTLFGGLRRTYRANNCSGGRIQNCHIKPDFWRDSHWPGNPSEDNNLGAFKWDIGTELEAIYLNGCTNYTLMSIFNHASHNFVTVDNSSGQAMMVSSEQVQHGYTFMNGSQPFDFMISGACINNIGDYSGQYGIKTLPGFTGKTRFFAGYHWGTSGESWASEDGHLYLQQCFIGGFKKKGAMNFISDPNGTLTLESCESEVFLGIDNQGSLTMKDCNFKKGLLNSVVPQYGADNQFDSVYILSDLNQDPPQAFGIELDMSNVEVVDAVQEVPSTSREREKEGRRNKAVRLSSGSSFYLNVTDPQISNGLKQNASFELLFMVDENCTIDIYYDRAGGGMTLGRSITYDLAGADLAWKTVTFSRTNVGFDAADNIDIRIDVSAVSTILAMVAVSSTDLPAIPPAAPTGLVATSGIGSISLDWLSNNEPDLWGYGVYRSETTGGPYTHIQDVLNSSYIDNNVNNGTVYYYVVTAVDSSDNESANSNEDSAPPPDLTDDDRVDMDDLAIVSAGWLTLYDMNDLSVIAENWLIN